MALSRRAFLKLSGGGAFGSLGGGFYATAIEPLWLERVDVEVPVEGLHPALDGYTVAQLSDFHVGAGVPDSHILASVAMANAASPDLVALTGDFVHRGATGGLAGKTAELLSGLRARDGVFGCLGNHDAAVYSGNSRRRAPEAELRRLMRTLDQSGMRVLQNESVTIRRGPAALRVCGMGDLWSRRFRPDSLPGKAPGAPRIVLSHNPDTAPELARHGAELILCGHTHGGQVNIPFFGPPILPVVHKEFAAGLFSLGESRLYVNRGVGWLRRIRFDCRPEVTVLRLRAATPPAP